MTNILDEIFNDASVVCNEILDETQRDYYLFYGIFVISSRDVFIDELKKPIWFEYYKNSWNTYEVWKSLENDILRFNLERFLTAYPLIHIVDRPIKFDIKSFLNENHILFNIKSDDELLAWKFSFNISKMSFSSIAVFYNLFANMFPYYYSTLILNETNRYTEVKVMPFKNMPLSYPKLIRKRIHTKNSDKMQILRDYDNSLITLNLFFK